VPTLPPSTKSGQFRTNEMLQMACASMVADCRRIVCASESLHRVVEYLGGVQLYRQRSPFRAPSFLPLRPDALAANHVLQRARFVGLPKTFRDSRHRHVADFAGGPAASAIEPAFEHHAGSDSGSNREKDEV
jgi:hypothetical protein